MSECLTCGLEHGCGGWLEADSPAASARCSHWCNIETCDEADCLDCQEREGCPRPPSSPSAPPSPEPPPMPPATPPPPCTGTQIGQTCMYTHCCQDPEHTCFRKTGRRGTPYGYATCRLTCPVDGTYDCEILFAPPPYPPARPPAPQSMEAPQSQFQSPTGAKTSIAMPWARNASCAAMYQNCFNSRCCQVRLAGCFRRKGKQFAMCKPLLPLGQQCFGDDPRDPVHWQCPGWYIPPPSPPTLPPAPLVLLLPSPLSSCPPPSASWKGPSLSSRTPSRILPHESGRGIALSQPVESVLDVYTLSPVIIALGAAAVSVSCIGAVAVCCIICYGISRKCTEAETAEDGDVAAVSTGHSARSTKGMTARYTRQVECEEDGER